MHSADVNRGKQKLVRSVRYRICSGSPDTSGANAEANKDENNDRPNDGNRNFDEGRAREGSARGGGGFWSGRRWRTLPYDDMAHEVGDG